MSSTLLSPPRWYVEDLERVHVLAELKNLPVAPLDLLVCPKDTHIRA